MHLTAGPLLWHPRVSLRRGPLFADLYLVRICSGLKEAFLKGWVVGKEAPPYALGFDGQRTGRSEETPILRPSHTALTGPLSTGQEETTSSCSLTCFPFLGKLGGPSSWTQCLPQSFSHGPAETTPRPEPAWRGPEMQEPGQGSNCCSRGLAEPRQACSCSQIIRTG